MDKDLKKEFIVEAVKSINNDEIIDFLYSFIGEIIKSEKINKHSKGKE